MQENEVYLGLGSNLGNRLANMRLALRLLASVTQVEAVSSLYETVPVGVAPQPPFYNAVCRIAAQGEPRELLRCVKEIEQQVGRRPGPAGEPRPVDIDILLWNQKTVDEADLVIPHPRLHKRAFVLVPLCQLAPGLLHPILRQTIRHLLGAVRTEGVQEIRPRGWETE